MCIFSQISITAAPVQSNHTQATSRFCPVTGPEEPRGFQEVKVPIFHDNGSGWW